MHCSGLGVSLFFSGFYFYFLRKWSSHSDVFLQKFFLRDNCDKRAFYFLDITKLLVWFIQVFYCNLQMISAVSFAQPQYKKWKASQIKINCHNMKLKIWNSSFLPCEWYENSAFIILGDSCIATNHRKKLSTWNMKIYKKKELLNTCIRVWPKQQCCDFITFTTFLLHLPPE